VTPPFVTQLRTTGDVLRVGAGEPVISLRVQLAEAWDTVRVEAPSHEPVVSVKVRALEALAPDARRHEDYVLKLNGFEILDENASLADAGAVDGSIFLLSHRRRRPVR
jgi:hypothetical protein